MAKAKEIFLVNTGVCSIFFNGDLVLPDGEFQVTEEDLNLPGIEHLIGNGTLTIKNDMDRNSEVVKRAASKRRKDPDEGKTREQLEDGGIY